MVIKMNLPNDPIMLLSYINTQLRDFYPTLDDLCQSLGVNKDSLITKLGSVDYHYDKTQNRFM